MVTHEDLKDRKYLIPGWAGDLSDEELKELKRILPKDAQLSRTWGFRPSQKTRSEGAINRVAMDGDPDDIAHNRHLARPRKGQDTKSLPISIAEKIPEPAPLVSEPTSPDNTPSTPTLISA